MSSAVGLRHVFYWKFSDHFSAIYSGEMFFETV